MSLIYEPSGKAREYSPLALNIYNGCSHRCKYCYLRTLNSLLSAPVPTPKKDILKNLDKELSKTQIKNQVLLSFVSDIYCEGAEITRDVLKILIKYQIPIAILTKNKNVIKDIDLFQQFNNIKIGMTFTFSNNKDSLEYEPGASLPHERFKALEIIHNSGIKTFASFEPVIYPEQTLSIMEKVKGFVDMYKIGKLNNISFGKSIDWKKFGNSAISLCKKYNKDFYIKKDLLQYTGTSELDYKNYNPDYWALKKETIRQADLF